MRPSAGAALSALDQARRQTGRLFDALGLGPRMRPSAVVDVAAGVRLRRYPPDASDGPAVLLVPAPIKRSYIWDLAPGASAVDRCLQRGLRSYLVEWIDPGPDEQDFGLDDYADRLLTACLRVVAEESGQSTVPMIGHSLGGTFSAICTARHPELVAAVALLEAPLHFGSDAGALAVLVAATPPAVADRLSSGAVPGTFLDVATTVAAPDEMQLDRYSDLARSMGDRDALVTHLRVQRWTLDEFALPGRLFGEVLERLYRGDQFHRGTLVVSGQQVGPATLVAPMLNVIDPRSRLIPPSSIVPFHVAAAAPRKRLLEYGGDTGVALQHVGVLVGRNAHRQLWPEILDWLR